MVLESVSDALGIVGQLATTLAMLTCLVMWFLGQEREVARLRRHGFRVSAQVVGHRLHLSTVGAEGVAAGPLYQVEAIGTDPDTGLARTFQSEPIPADVARHYRAGTRVEVYIDPRDSRVYYVDVTRR